MLSHFFILVDKVKLSRSVGGYILELTTPVSAPVREGQDLRSLKFKLCFEVNPRDWLRENYPDLFAMLDAESQTEPEGEHRYMPPPPSRPIPRYGYGRFEHRSRTTNEVREEVLIDPNAQVSIAQEPIGATLPAGAFQTLNVASASSVTPSYQRYAEILDQAQRDMMETLTREARLAATSMAQISIPLPLENQEVT